MSLFDYYEPKDLTQCPKCGNKLNNWQGKDGPCGLFVWVQGSEHPKDQKADDSNLPSDKLKNKRLPESFKIYTYDCPEHNPIIAQCHTNHGIWSYAEINDKTL